jgi:endonuclease YncB( thermonuclease family)
MLKPRPEIAQIRLIPVLFSAALLAACEPSGSLDLGGSQSFAASADISGLAEVIDGDSLDIDGISIRLFGVDAFEGRQPCLRNGAPWRCGDAASRKLTELVGESTIECVQRDIDSYGRVVARCTNGRVDLAAEIARSGLGLAYRQYSMDYVDEEADAQAAGRGAWAGTFDAPWEWRRGEPPGAPTQAPTPGHCVIKGNISREGERIYHLPGSTYHEQTVIDESAGERWFCSEQDAIAAGWRASRAR